MQIKTIGVLLILAGIIGIAMQSLLPSLFPGLLPKNDMLKGLVFGVSIGLEILGMMLVNKSQHSNDTAS